MVRLKADTTDVYVVSGFSRTSTRRHVDGLEPRHELGRPKRLWHELEVACREISHRQLIVDVTRADNHAAIGPGREVVVDQLTGAAARHDAVRHQHREFSATLAYYDAPRFDIANLDDTMARLPGALSISIAP